MNEILYRASVMVGVPYDEFVAEIKKAQKLVGAQDLETDEFVKKLTLLALERYIGDCL